MPTPTPHDTVEANQNGPSSLARGYASDPGVLDEMIEADGSLRPHWRQFISMLDELGPGELGQRWEQAKRLIHENGVTHNVYGDPSGLDRPWSLDLIPLLIPSEQWNHVSEGLTQRARLLDELLRDLYGPAKSVAEGLLPPELVWANPGFLRPCHGIRLPQNRWLHLYAADLVRDSAGQYEVLSDRTQAPSGAGYSLENRIVLSRALPSPFRQCNVERLAPFFGSLRDSLASLSLAGREDPHVVLLTPGPYNETYFEHSYLARYLGYSLVQGNDLTVRDNHVYLKTLGGLQRVDVILRRVDDGFCDPVELYAGSYLGVPGLLQAIRVGNVAVANALGAGVLQAPGFLPFLPALCRGLLDEELKLPSVPTWWCGQPKGLRYVIDHISVMVIKSAYPTAGEDPVFAHTLTRAQISELIEKMKAHPDKYVGQNQIATCTMPALVDGQMLPRRSVLRSYLAAQGDSYAVMHGALTRVTQSGDSLVVSLQQGGGSKDTWILAERPVTYVTLLPPASQPVALSRGGGDLPSRIADDLFWLGRYVERADWQARLARGVSGRIIDQSGVENAHAIEVLSTAWHQEIRLPAGAEFTREVITGVLGEANGAGLRGVVTSVHGLARILRDHISADAWRVLQEIHRTVEKFEIRDDYPSLGVPELLNDLVLAFAAFAGLVSDSMPRGQAWRFLDIGRRIERAAFVARLLRDTLVDPGADPVLLEALLEIADSSQTYRRRYFTHWETHAVADLLLADETNPRSVAHQLALIDDHLATLPRDQARRNMHPDHRIVLRLRSSIELADLAAVCSVAAGGRRDALDSFLSDILGQVRSLADAIAQMYFSHATVSRVHGDVRKEAAP
jgi:uncharacterized circularly permuted ATP-grasp superfamily protein/uncharacterized alpha-E superfamily protein